MKKNYIAPATENVMFGTSPIMDGDPFIGMSAASGGAAGAKQTGDLNYID